MIAKNRPTTSFTNQKSKLQVDGRPKTAECTRNYLEKLRYYHERVEKATSKGKIFQITTWNGGSTIASALKARGWIEKNSKAPPSCMKKFYDKETVKKAEPGNIYEDYFLSRLIGYQLPSLIWGAKLPLSNCKTVKVSGIKFDELNFTIKNHLRRLAEEQIHWHLDDNPQARIPRSHLIENPLAYMDFQKDFRFTALKSILMFMNNREFMEDFFDPEGKIESEILDFAIELIQREVRAVTEHFDVDGDMDESIWESQIWLKVFKAHEDLVKLGEQFKVAKREIAKNYVTLIKSTTKDILDTWPWVKYDGFHNIWISKPVNSSCGNGILLFDKEEKIGENCRCTSKIVQKYIETPFLYHNTKFDVRVYLLVVVSPVDIKAWVHRECYFKLSTHPFSLDKLDDSIHVTNHTVQKRYKPANPKLPSHRMLSVKEFEEHLISVNKEDAWEEMTFPAIKNVLLAVLMSCVDGIDPIIGRYQLFGADFLVTDDLEPFLVEINPGPDMSFSTPTTGEVCMNVLEDVVRVLVDYEEDKNASIGGFEPIFNMSHSKSKYLPIFVRGERLLKSRGKAYNNKIASIPISRVSLNTKNGPNLQIPSTASNLASMQYFRPVTKRRSILNERKLDEKTIESRDFIPPKKPPRPLYGLISKLNSSSFRT